MGVPVLSLSPPPDPLTQNPSSKTQRKLHKQVLRHPHALLSRNGDRAARGQGRRGPCPKHRAWHGGTPSGSCLSSQRVAGLAQSTQLGITENAVAAFGLRGLTTVASGLRSEDVGAAVGAGPVTGADVDGLAADAAHWGALVRLERFGGVAFVARVFRGENVSAAVGAGPVAGANVATTAAHLASTAAHLASHPTSVAATTPEAATSVASVSAPKRRTASVKAAATAKDTFKMCATPQSGDDSSHHICAHRLWRLAPVAVHFGCEDVGAAIVACPVARAHVAVTSNRSAKAAHVAVWNGLGRMASIARRLRRKHVGAAIAARPVARAHIYVVGRCFDIHLVLGLEAGLGCVASVARCLGRKHMRAAVVARPVARAHVPTSSPTTPHHRRLNGAIGSRRPRTLPLALLLLVHPPPLSRLSLERHAGCAAQGRVWSMQANVGACTGCTTLCPCTIPVGYARSGSQKAYSAAALR
mmetsp:Transcript_47471/g.101342  ORF Transcript_47471/g.101342 Transcript_47471/m.101342 type:complete len:472 (-) Transcript_47471:4-1419(-)